MSWRHRDRQLVGRAALREAVEHAGLAADLLVAPGQPELVQERTGGDGVLGRGGEPALEAQDRRLAGDELLEVGRRHVELEQAIVDVVGVAPEGGEDADRGVDQRRLVGNDADLGGEAQEDAPAQRTSPHRLELGVVEGAVEADPLEGDAAAVLRPDRDVAVEGAEVGGRERHGRPVARFGELGREARRAT